MIGIKLEEECWKCEGTGEEMIYPSQNFTCCSRCGGIKSTPTESGIELLKFMRKYKDIELPE